MIILFCGFGLANRLLFFSYQMALAKASGHSLVSFSTPEADQFESGKSGALCVWPRQAASGIRYSNFFRRCCTFSLRKRLALDKKWSRLKPAVVWSNELTNDTLSAANPEFVEKVRSSRLIVITGWFSIQEAVIPHHAEARAFFTPIEPVRMLCRETAERARGEAEILIGIHVRWGDYQGFANGAYFFPLDYYVQVMRRCAELFPGKSVAFLLVGNEPEKLRSSHDVLGNLKITMGPGTAIGDMYSLAECDYIVSPNSTFSLWAAFYGKKPCARLHSRESLPELGDFAVPLDRFYDLYHDHTPWMPGRKPKRSDLPVISL